MGECSVFLPVRDYDLPATLNCGQAFRWEGEAKSGWEAVVAGRWVRLKGLPNGIQAQCATVQKDWNWLVNYLQTGLDYPSILASFPQDAPLQEAVQCCRGLRLLRQDPWECLASFILSSTKQIVQIRQIVRLLCERYGKPVPVPPGHAAAYAFPTPQELAGVPEGELRECKAGFRTAYLQQSAQRLVTGGLQLEALQQLPHAQAREQLQQLPGVGPKIADCVLLFAYGFKAAFPVDVWMAKVLREQYFPRRTPTKARLATFIANHFGPHAGYAQQYLFHAIRLKANRTLPPPHS
jgi:N-glycosylase/DNA lyase